MVSLHHSTLPAAGGLIAWMDKRYRGELERSLQEPKVGAVSLESSLSHKRKQNILLLTQKIMKLVSCCDWLENRKKGLS